MTRSTSQLTLSALVVIALIGGLALLGTPAAAQQTAEGPTVYVGANEEADGVGKVYAVDAETGEQEWNVTTNDDVTSGIVVVDGTLYATSEDQTLYAINAETGEIKWSVDNRHILEKSPVVADGTVYVGTVGYDIEDGNRVWKAEESEIEGSTYASSTVSGDTVYISSSNTWGDRDIPAKVYALDATSGDVEWEFNTTQNEIRSAPTVKDETIYIGAGGLDENSGAVYAIDAKTGQQEWQFETAGSARMTPTVADGIVYAGARHEYTQDNETQHEETLYALDADTGAKQWEKVNGDTDGSPTVVNGSVYDYGDDLARYDANDGTTAWSRSYLNSRSSPTVGDGVLYAGTDNATLIAVNTTNGDKYWTFTDPGSYVSSSPTIVQDPSSGSSSGSRVRLNTLNRHDRSTTDLNISPVEQTKPPGDSPEPQLPGSGTATDPYLISNASALQSIQQNLSAHYALANDIDASGTAGWNDGQGFQPIGDDPNPTFSGTLNGQGHTITGLVIDRPGEDHVGLFGDSGGKIADLALENIDITGRADVGGLVGDSYGSISNITVSGSVTGADDVGGLAGSSSGLVEAVSVEVTVTGNKTVGGLVGENDGRITNTAATGTITGKEDTGGLVGSNTGLGPHSEGVITNSSTSATVTGQESVGGLAGSSGREGTIRNVTASGEVTASGNGSDDIFYTGGLVGNNRGDIKGATASGDVVGDGKTGGLAGRNTGTITNATAFGPVNGTMRVGGLVGENSGLGQDAEGLIANSSASAPVTGEEYVGGLAGSSGREGTVQNVTASGDVAGDNNVGGLVGQNTGAITDATAFGPVNGTRTVGGLVGQHSESTISDAGGEIKGAQATGPVVGVDRVGGLVGSNAGTLRKTSASGTVTGEDTVGGLVGVNEKRSRLTGRIVHSMASGDVVGHADGYDVGGLIGDNEGVVNQTFAVGTVSGDGSVGGLVGSGTDSHVINSYWDINATNQTDSLGGSGLSTAAMTGDAARENMLGFNFQTVWQTTDQYPVLRSLSDSDSADGGEDKNTTAPVDLNASDLAGNGTVTDPYRITNASELQAMADEPSANYILGNDINASGTAAWNNGKGFRPVGEEKFSGTLDGQGHTITGLTINRPDASLVGLFSNNHGTIKNISLVDVEVTGIEVVGGLVGYNYGTIERVSVSGSVTAGYNVGGITGITKDGLIADARMSGNITGSHAGGITGDNVDSAISNISVSGSVTGDDTIGGLVGFNSGSEIKNARALATVNGDEEVGGLVGVIQQGAYFRQGTIDNTFAAGAVGGNTSVGGLVGMANDNNTTITNSYWNTETTTQDESVGGTGLTTVEMTGIAAKTNMSGLNFEDVWRTTDQYPVLRSLSDSVPEQADPASITRPEGYNIPTENGFIQPIDTPKPVVELNRDDVDQVDVVLELDALADHGIAVEPGGDVAVKRLSVDGTQGEPVTTSISGDRNELVISVGEADGAPIGGANNTIVFSELALAIDALGASPTPDGAISYPIDLRNATAVDSADSLSSINSVESSTYGFGIYDRGQVKFSADSQDITDDNVTIKTTLGDTDEIESEINTVSVLIINENGGPNNQTAELIGDASGFQTGSDEIRLDKNLSNLSSGDELRVAIYESDNLTPVGPPIDIDTAVARETNLDDLAGGGTEKNPYIITNVSGLQTISDDPSAHYILGDDIDASKTQHWGNGAGFDPIPEFTGTLRGQGHTVAGLYIYRPEENRIGLVESTGSFESTKTGTITGISLVNLSITGASWTGSVAGYNFGEISNISVTGKVSGDDYVGGLAGDSNGEFDGGVIERSYSTATVNGNDTVGGLVGLHGNGGIITSSYAAGEVTGASTVGGLVGDSYGTDPVTSSYWDTAATGQTVSAVNATGLTTAKMTETAARTNMSGLDFEETWQTTNQYPVLQSLSDVKSPGDGDNNESVNINRSASTATPAVVPANTTTQLTMQVTATGLSNASAGEIYLSAADFELNGTSSDDVTIDFTQEAISNGTVNVSTPIDAQAPAESGTYPVNVTDLRIGGTANPDKPLIEDVNITIDTINISQFTPPQAESVKTNTSRAADAVTVTGNLSAGDGQISEVRLGLGAQMTAFEYTRTITEGVADGGNISTTINTANLPADGVYEPVATVVDTAGRTNTTTGSPVTVDTTPPELHVSVSDLGTATAQAHIEVTGELAPVTLTDVSITATADSETNDRTPSEEQIPAAVPPADSESITFNGTPIESTGTTFNITVTGTDAAGNEQQTTLESTIQDYSLTETGQAELDPAFDTLAPEIALRAEANASASQAIIAASDALPADTAPAQNQVLGSVLMVKDSGLPEEDLQSATIRIPLEEVTVEAPADDLRIFKSEDGSSAYEPIPTQVRENMLVANVSGFSQFAPGTVDDTPPTVTNTEVTPGTELQPTDGPVTITVEYSDDLSAIDLSKTDVATSVAPDRVDAQLTREQAKVTLTDLSAGETIDVTLTIADTADNERTLTRTITVQAPTTESTPAGSDDDDGDSPSVDPSPSAPTPDSTPQVVDSDRAIGELVELAPDADPAVATTAEPVDGGVTFIGETNVETVDLQAPADAVTAVRYEEPPASLPSPPGRTGTLARIAVDGPAAEEPGTVRMRVFTAELEAADAEPDAIQIARYDGTEWASLETSVVEQTEQSVLVEAQTPQFSYFATAITTEDERAADNGSSTNQTSSSSAGGGLLPIPGFGVTVAILVLLGAALVATKRH